MFFYFFVYNTEYIILRRLDPSNALEVSHQANQFLSEMYHMHIDLSNMACQRIIQHTLAYILQYEHVLLYPFRLWLLLNLSCVPIHTIDICTTENCTWMDL